MAEILALSFANAGSKEPMFLCSLYLKTCLDLASTSEELHPKNMELKKRRLPISSQKYLDACFVIIYDNCKFVHLVKVQE